MAHQVIVHPQAARRHRRRNVAEAAGGSTAECAAVCCCCPCAVVHFLVLAVYKVPKGLVTKATHKRRRRLTKKNNIDNYRVVLGNMQNDVALLPPAQQSSTALEYAVSPTLFEEFVKKKEEKQKEEEEGLDKEMWARFAGTGFWRSNSQRQP